jgi:hypothetical protein
MADPNDETRPAPQYPEGDTRNQTWPEYFKKTFGNISESAQKYGSGVVSGLNPVNLPQTIEGMGALGRGAIYNFMGKDYMPPHAGEPIPETARTPVQKMIAIRQGYGEDPAQIAREKNLASEVGKGIPPVFKYTMDEGWQGRDPEKWHEFGQRFQEDPVGTASLAAIPVSGAGGVLGKIAGTGSRVAEAANLPSVADALNVAKTAGNVAEKAKYADPLTAGFGLAGSTGKAISNAASHGSGIQEFQPIMDLFAKGGKEGEIARNSYKEFSAGNGDYNSFLKNLNDEIDAVHQEKLEDWGARKSNLQNNPVDLTDVESELINSTAAKGSKKYMGDETRAAIERVEKPDGLLDRLTKLKELPDTDPSRKLFGVDQYKQSLWDEIAAAKKRGDSALLDILNPVYKKTTEVISTYGDSEYAALMDDYRNIVSEMRDLNVAAGSNKPSVSQFRTILSSRKNPIGRSILDDIVKRNPYLEGAFLGDITHKTGKPFKPNVIDVASIPAAAIAQSYHPLGAAAVAALEMGRLGLGSPSLTTAVPKIAGALKRNPVTASVKSLIEAAPSAARVIAPFQGAMESAYDKRLKDMRQNDAEKILEGYRSPAEADGGRIGRESGGRTNMSAAAKAARLIDRVDHIRKSHGKETSSLLNLDDDTVAKALDIANQRI